MSCLFRGCFKLRGTARDPNGFNMTEKVVHQYKDRPQCSEKTKRVYRQRTKTVQSPDEAHVQCVTPSRASLLMVKVGFINNALRVALLVVNHDMFSDVDPYTHQCKLTLYHTLQCALLSDVNRSPATKGRPVCLGYVLSMLLFNSIFNQTYY